MKKSITRILFYKFKTSSIYVGKYFCIQRNFFFGNTNVKTEGSDTKMSH